MKTIAKDNKTLGVFEKIPTHFRFKDKIEAAHWSRTTKDWIPISSIQTNGDNDYFDISAASFAWVSFNVKNPNLEFKSAKFSKKDLKKFEDD